MSEPTSSAGNIAGLRFKQQSSAPSAPPAGYSLQYWKTDGLPYYKGPDNVEHGFRTGIPLLDADNTFTGVNTFAGTSDDPGTKFAITIDGDPALTVDDNRQVAAHQVRSNAYLDSDGDNMFSAAGTGTPIGVDKDMVWNIVNKGPILPDRSDGHTYRLKVTGGVLGVEMVS